MIYIHTLAACKLWCLLTVKGEKQIYFFSYDSLTIYDGGSSTSPMMGKYCGASIPPSHISSSKEIMVHFKTALFIGLNAFKMEYNPTGKKNTLIQINNEYYENYYREKLECYSSISIVAVFLFLNVHVSITIFSRPLLTIILSQKWRQMSERFFVYCLALKTYINM